MEEEVSKFISFSVCFISNATHNSNNNIIIKVAIFPSRLYRVNPDMKIGLWKSRIESSVLSFLKTCTKLIFAVAPDKRFSPFRESLEPPCEFKRFHQLAEHTVWVRRGAEISCCWRKKKRKIWGSEWPKFEMKTLCSLKWSSMYLHTYTNSLKQFEFLLSVSASASHPITTTMFSSFFIREKNRSPKSNEAFCAVCHATRAFI